MGNENNPHQRLTDTVKQAKLGTSLLSQLSDLRLQLASALTERDEYIREMERLKGELGVISVRQPQLPTPPIATEKGELGA